MDRTVRYQIAQSVILNANLKNNALLKLVKGINVKFLIAQRLILKTAVNINVTQRAQITLVDQTVLKQFVLFVLALNHAMQHQIVQLRTAQVKVVKIKTVQLQLQLVLYLCVSKAAKTNHVSVSIALLIIAHLVRLIHLVFRQIYA